MGNPYGQPGYPSYGQPPGYQPPAGGGTAITAGILALVTGGLNVLGAAAVAAVDAKILDVTPGKVQFAAIAAGFIAFLLILGGVLLLCRLTAGRVMVILGCSLALVNMVIGVALFGVFSPTSAVGIVLMIATMSLAAVGPTGRWIAARRSAPQSFSPYGQPAPPPYGSPAPLPYGQPAQPVPYSQSSQPFAAPYAQSAPYGQPSAAPYGQQPPDPYQQPTFQAGQYPYPQQSPTGQPPYPYQ